MIRHLRMELSNLQLSLQRNIQTNPQQFDLCQKCFILMVSIDSSCLIKKYFEGFLKIIGEFLLRPLYVSVYADGSICLDILQNRWSPTYDASAILTSIQVSYP